MVSILSWNFVWAHVQSFTLKLSLKYDPCNTQISKEGYDICPGKFQSQHHKELNFKQVRLTLVWHQCHKSYTGLMSIVK